MWKLELLAALYDNVYARRLECPSCGGELDFVASREIGTAGTVSCRTCAAEHLVSVEGDPLRSQFRDYTDTEKQQIFAADRKRELPACPIDETHHGRSRATISRPHV